MKCWQGFERFEGHFAKGHTPFGEVNGNLLLKGLDV